MYNAVRTTGYASTLYFIILVVFGRIILFTLVTAVLIDSFHKQKALQEEQTKLEKEKELAEKKSEL